MKLLDKGEKVLIFCHYLATGDVLCQTIAEKTEAQIAARAAGMPGCSKDEAAARLEQLTENRFSENSTATQEIYEQIGPILGSYPAVIEQRERHRSPRR